MPLVLMAAWEAYQVQLGTVVQITRSPEPEIALTLLGEALRSVLLVLWPLMLATLVGVFAAAALQGGVRFKKFALKGSTFSRSMGSSASSACRLCGRA